MATSNEMNIDKLMILLAQALEMTNAASAWEIEGLGAEEVMAMQEVHGDVLELLRKTGFLAGQIEPAEKFNADCRRRDQEDLESARGR